MKKIMLYKMLLGSTLVCSGAFFLAAQQAAPLIRMGNMDHATAKSFRQEIRLNGGSASLFTEDLTWNKCGKLTLGKFRKQKQYTVANAQLFIGGDTRGVIGFPCKPNTAYEFSIDIKGTAHKLSLRGANWTDPKRFYSFKVLPGGKDVKPSGQWVNVKGEFKTGPNAVRAALQLQMWWSTRWGVMKYKEGDYVLFDNVVVREKGLSVFGSQPKKGAAFKAGDLKIIKTASTHNGVITDFNVIRTTRKVKGATSVRFSSDKKGIRLLIHCKEPDRITVHKKDLWKGDTVEIFFGPRKNDRQLTQFVVSPDGKTYTGRGLGGKTKENWTYKVKQGKGFYEIDACIPFATLGWTNPKNGDEILFNIGRSRKAAKEVQSWAPVKSSFHDVGNFGILRLGPYPSKMNRAQYEKFAAEQKAKAIHERMEKASKYNFLVAKVSVTDDNTLPYLPSALLDPPDEIRVNAAINEIKGVFIAIANKTDKTMTYRVTLERPIPAKGWQSMRERPFPGVTAREGVALRDNKEGSGALIDALPKMNEASTITIGPKSASLVLFDINTKGMKAGVHKGVLRVVPLTGRGGFKGGSYWNCVYEGEMRCIPFTLNVRNIVLSEEPVRPGAYSAGAVDPVTFRLAQELGQRIYKFSPWYFKWKLKNGVFEKSCPQAEQALDHAKKIGMKRLMIAYSCHYVFISMYGKKNEKYFPMWLKKIVELIKAKGFDPAECEIEIFDEPSPSRIDHVVEVCRIVKKTIPELPTLIAFGAHGFSMTNLERLRPYIDIWDFWRFGYFRKKEHLAFIAKLQKEGKKIRHYTCATNPRASLHSNSRINAWFGEYHNVDSDSMYRLLDDRTGIAWMGPTAGEQLIFIANGTVPTMRYMALRKGVTDVKYLAKLREVGKNSPEAQKFLKTAAKRVVIDSIHDRKMPDIVREEAAQLILKLQKKAK